MLSEVPQKIRLVVIFLVIRKEKQDNLIAIGRKKSDSPKSLAGCWHIPGGESNEDDYANQESFADIIKNITEREAEEELGIKVAFRRIIHSQGIMKPDKNEFLQMVYVLCCPLNDLQTNLCAGGDLVAVSWVPFNKVLSYLDAKAIEHLYDGIKLFITSII